MADLQLTVEQAVDARDMALKTWERNRDNPNWSYPNRLPTHQVGKLGEVAAETWLRDCGVVVDAAFRDPNREW